MNTLFRDDRIRRVLSDLRGIMYHSCRPVSPVLMADGRYDCPAQAALAKSDAVFFGTHDRWGGRCSYCWFSAELDLPEAYRKEELLLRVSTTEYQQGDTSMMASFVSSPASSWDLMNPQFMLFVNGGLRQGMDTNHTEVFLERKDYEDGHITLEFQAYAGLTDSFYNFIPELLIVNVPVKNLYYDILTIFEAALTMDESAAERSALLNVLNNALNCLDLRAAGTEAFGQGVHRAAALIQKQVYDKRSACNPSFDKTVTCIGHTHIDMAWLWDLSQTRLKAQRSFSTVLSMMKRYPDYMFMHSSPQLYAWLKQDNPELYEGIREQIRSGRWEPEGAMWIEADCNIPCGESFIRQILYGKAFFREEFGTESHVLWMPDVFGYSAALPQILKKSGINCFVTSKISWNMLNAMPYDTFLWKGIDGEEILTYFLTSPELGAASGNCGATYNAVLHPETVAGTWKQYKQKEINQNVLMCYGYGDGGGGPTVDMLEKLERLEKGIPGFPTVRSGSIGQFFDNLVKSLDGNRYLPKWSGELYLELHQGTYTSNGEIKRNNRHAEHSLLTVEWLESAAMLLGGAYHAEELKVQWQSLLLNQFHDILPGSCIHKVYEDSREQFAQLFCKTDELMATSLKRIVAAIHMEKEGFLVFNPCPFSQEGVMEIPCVPDAAEGQTVCYYDSSGRLLDAQRSGDGRTLISGLTVPAHGYSAVYPTLHIEEQKEQESQQPVFSLSESRMENERYLLLFDEYGEISRLFDKTGNRELIPDGCTGNRLVAFDDRPYKWDSWNIDMYYEEQSFPVREHVSTEITEYGPLRFGIRQVKKYHNSLITQTIYLYRDSPRIDFVTDVDWQEDSTLLKAEFPTDLNSDYATYDIQFGNVRRPTHTNTSWDVAKYEVCAHQWADLSEGGYGIGLLNDCKYGYSIRNGIISLTLLKAGMAPDRLIDRGKHHFTYSLLPHTGNCYEGGAIQEAFRLNRRPFVAAADAHDGILPENGALISCPQENIIMETLKLSEDGTALILRMYETCNTRTIASVSLPFELSRLEECDLMENPIGGISLTDANTFSVLVKPFEIKTYKLFKEV